MQITDTRALNRTPRDSLSRRGCLPILSIVGQSGKDEDVSLRARNSCG